MSTDWAQTWTAHRDFFDFDTDQQVYMATALLADGKTMRVGVSGHPKEYYKKPLHDVWACLVDLETGAVTLPSSGKEIGNLKTGAGMPLNYPALELVQKTAADRTVNLFDVSSGPVFEIGYVSKIKDDMTTRDGWHHVASLRDGSWIVEDIAPTGRKFGYIDAGSLCRQHRLPRTCRVRPALPDARGRRPLALRVLAARRRWAMDRDAARLRRDRSGSRGLGR